MVPSTLHSESYKEVVDALIAARKSSGLTQQQVADKLGRPQSFVAKIEGLQRRIDIVEFLELSRIVKADALAIINKTQRDISKGKRR